MDYAVCQIAGKQVIVTPGKEIVVPFLGDITNFESDKVILISQKGKVSLGAPFLKEKLKFDVVGEFAQKSRVAFYKPKANHRKATGQNTKLTKIRLAA